MDGLTAVEHIMAEVPTPILMLTADPRHQAPELTYKALELGALALQIKPSIDAGTEAWNLSREVKLLSSVKVIRHLRSSQRRSPVSGPHGTVPTPAPMGMPYGVIAVASSTGGPQVLHRMVSELPADFPIPICIVQHINAAFSDSLAGWLGNSSKLKVRLARDGEQLLPGNVLIAPPGQHLVIPRARQGEAGEERGARRAHALGHGAAGERGQGLRAALRGRGAHGHGRGRGGWAAGHPSGGRGDAGAERGVLRGVWHAGSGRGAQGGGPPGPGDDVATALLG
jgi:CheY-like chemotaxis protein